MAVFFTDGGESATNAFFGAPTDSAKLFMEQSFHNYMEATSSRAEDLQYIRDRFETVNSRSNEMLMESMRRKINSVWKTDCIRTLGDIESIQTAPKAMQRYVMAHPELRKIYLDGGCNGYRGEYASEDHNVGVMHYDYRRVYDGVMQAEGEKVVTREFVEAARGGEAKLTLMEKVSIIATHRILSMSLQESTLDPTSVENETLS